MNKPAYESRPGAGRQASRSGIDDISQNFDDLFGGLGPGHCGGIDFF